MYVNSLKRDEPDFPQMLSVIAAPPDQIYWGGINPQQWLDKPKVAIVGSRKATAYGRSVTTKIGKELAEAGVVIISGLAYGVDVTAHQAALAANGTTVAVLPGSIDYIYPAAHHHIAQQIAHSGSLITEYDQAAINFKSNFIARNRLISGLCDILLITEAGLKSGSLHTARFALEQGKTVMAVPGNINSPTSEGCNNLIKSGAIPVTSVDDVFFALKLKPSQQRQITFSGSEQERAVLELISVGVNNQEELAIASKLEAAAISSALTMLEITGQIRAQGNGNWARA